MGVLMRRHHRKTIVHKSKRVPHFMNKHGLFHFFLVLYINRIDHILKNSDDSREIVGARSRSRF